MNLRKFTIIYLAINTVFLLPPFLGELNIIGFISNLPLVKYFTPLFGIHMIALLWYGLLFLSFAHIMFFVVLLIINIRFSIKERKTDIRFYLIFTTLMAFNIYLNILCREFAMIAVRQ
jgi:hypothetical protein